jgi:hypothetical protein
MIQTFFWSLNFLLLSFMGSGSGLVPDPMLWFIFKFSSPEIGLGVGTELEVLMGRGQWPNFFFW